MLRTLMAATVALCTANGGAFAACPSNANAITIAPSRVITGDGNFHKTGLTLTVRKLSNQSQLFYTNQITFQFNAPGPYGAQFQMRVKDANDNYIMPNMQTGSVSTSPNTYYNAMLSDTVYDKTTGNAPVAGTYTFELWALANSATLTLVSPMSNIAVLELPNAACSS